MSSLLTLLVLAGVGWGLRRFGLWWSLAGTALVAGLLWLPLPTLAIAVAAGALAWRRWLAGRRTDEQQAVADVGLLSELTLLGLNAGLTFSNALALGAEHVAPPLRREVWRVRRRSSHTGPAEVLRAGEGHASGLYLLAAQATLTGAPIAPAVQAFVEERRAEERAAALAAARRLPVRLLFPLALLILPGFMVLTVGPAMLTALQRLTS